MASGEWRLAVATQKETVDKPTDGTRRARTKLTSGCKASQADASVDLRGKIIRLDEKDPQKEYENAQQRLNEHLAALRAAGKSADAAKIEAAIQASEANKSLSETASP